MKKLILAAFLVSFNASANDLISSGKVFGIASVCSIELKESNKAKADKLRLIGGKMLVMIDNLDNESKGIILGATEQQIQLMSEMSYAEQVNLCNTVFQDK
ncbi:hypothetical protein [Moritella sp. F3]|uniref:hypothetical protein n=1 Tax=Moritella sp. F3 TaxID=2718882 RepID=UPI0018E17CEE|nr:hypothetical protein [Moritella sp. F3]GIC78861.1 hypothetical protein FMO001_35880 [Moritella sp. F1]GIC81904.1 hypothetical protein FMO003_21850 [Moritella sp. F3]